MLKTVHLVASITLLFSSVGVVLCQPNQLRGNSGSRRKRKPTPLDAEPFSTIEVNYPMNIFDIGGSDSKDWRSTAIFSSYLHDLSEKDKPYLGFARAQDQEDVWLYENWFYGMKGKVGIDGGFYCAILTRLNACSQTE